MTVEERLEALEKEIQRLKDVQAIKELKNKYFGREKFKEEHKKELSGYYRSERILKENLDPSGKIPGRTMETRSRSFIRRDSCFTKRR